MISIRSHARLGLAVLLLAGAAGCGRAAHRTDHPREAVGHGWDDYRLGEFKRAVEFFEAARQAAPAGSDDHLQALYGLATTWNLRLPAQDQDKRLAADLYRQVLELGPRSELAPWAALALARLKHLVPVGEDADYAIVRPAYEEIIAKYPGTLTAREAFIYLTATKVATFKTNELREAIAGLRAFVADESDRSFRQPAYSLMAVAYNALNLQQERLEAEIASLEETEVDPTNPYNEFSWQYWNIATIAEFELGDFETARAYYRKLLEEYPRDRKIYGVKVALQRMDEIEARIRQELARGGGS